MTDHDRFAKIMGYQAPNVDPETGIHYGVIHRNHLKPDAVDDIFTGGTDVQYLSARRDLQAALRGIVEFYWSSQDDPELRLQLDRFLDEHVFNGGRYLDEMFEIVRDSTASDPDALALEVFDVIADTWNDYWESSGPYRLEEDLPEGKLVTQVGEDGDVWVFQSPWFTYCGECSPCAPNAGYLTTPVTDDEGTSVLKTYCLPRDWFEKEPPYPVFKR